MSTPVVQNKMKKEPRKRGRPVTVEGPVTAIRLTPDLTIAIDDWRRKQQDLPARSVAIRRLIERGLKP
jgi:hypothetical protein